jgi:hypothetical protein
MRTASFSADDSINSQDDHEDGDNHVDEDGADGDNDDDVDEAGSFA